MKSQQRHIPVISVISVFRQAVVVALILLLSAKTSSAQNPDWEKPYEPFRIAGNLYYVGTYDLACYLITTPKGHILINAAIKSTVPMIRSNVEALGFKFSDIKIILSSQAHYDHVGGMAEIQRLTGAKVMIDEKDIPVMNDGGNSDFLFGGKGIGSLFKPVKVDRALHDRDIIELGGMKLTFLHHPGHTKGASSYLLNVRDEQRSYEVLIANMPSVLDETNLSSAPSYAGIAADYAYTFKAMKALKFDLWMCAHASQFDLQDKHKNGSAYNPNAFMDRAPYDAELAEMEQKYLNKLGK